MSSNELKQTSYHPITNYYTGNLSEEGFNHLMTIADEAGLRKGEHWWWCHSMQCFRLSVMLDSVGRCKFRYDEPNGVLIDFKQMEDLLKRVRYNKAKSPKTEQKDNRVEEALDKLHDMKYKCDDISSLLTKKEFSVCLSGIISILTSDKEV